MVNRCIDCGKAIKWGAIRCKNCNMTMRWDRGDFGERRIRYCCTDCGVEISHGAVRCHSCVMKKRWKDGDLDKLRVPPAFCEDCGAQLRVREFRRCRSCIMKANRAQGVYDHIDYKALMTEEMKERLGRAAKENWDRGCYDDLGTKVSDAWANGAYDHVDYKALMTEEVKEQLRQATKKNWAQGCYDGVGAKVSKAWADGIHDEACTEEVCAKISEAAKRNWKQGTYSGVFQTPTKPERAVKSVLDFMCLAYEYNSFCLEGRLFDFYLPDHNVLIEYDGWYWHQTDRGQEGDAIKDCLAQEASLPLIRLKGTKTHDLTAVEIWAELCFEFTRLGIY